MSNFAELILGAPRGFVAGCKAFNSLVDADDGGAACDAVVDACRVSYMEDRPVSGSSSSLNISHVEEVKVLSYIVYSSEHTAGAPKPTVPEMAAVLDNNSFLSRNAITKIIAGIDSVTTKAKKAVAADTDDIPENVFEELRKTSNFGRLSNLQWRLGVALQSSKCQSLNAPYVALSFDIVDNNGCKVRAKRGKARLGCCFFNLSFILFLCSSLAACLCSRLCYVMVAFFA